METAGMCGVRVRSRGEGGERDGIGHCHVLVVVK